MQITGLGAKVRLKMSQAQERKAERKFTPDAMRYRKRLARDAQRAYERRANRHAARKRTEQERIEFIVDMQSRVAAGEFEGKHPEMTRNVRNAIRDGIRRNVQREHPYEAEEHGSFKRYREFLDHKVDQEIESVMSR